MIEARRHRLRSRQLVVLALAVGGLLAALALSFVVFEARGIRQHDLARVALYARALDDQLADTLASTESALRALAPMVDAVDAQATPGRLDTLLADAVRGRPALRSLSLLDAQGRVVASSQPTHRGLWLPRLRAPGAEGAAPRARLLGLATGRDLDTLDALPPGQARHFVLPLVLAVQAAGQGATLVAAMNPEHLATQFDRLLGDSQAQAMLLGLDGRVIAATPALPLAPGAWVPEAARATSDASAPPAMDSGTAIGPGALGPKVLGAWRMARHWPLHLRVELPHAAYLAPVKSLALWALAFLLVAWGLLGGGTWLARRALRRDEQRDRALRAAHAATKASESHKRAILQSALDAIVSFDHTGRIVDHNPAAERMFGLDGAALQGRPLHELLVWPALAGPLPGADAPRGALLNRHVETEARRGDGRRFPIELSIVPLATASGPLLTATMRDITERRQVEHALRDSEARAHATFEQAAVGMMQRTADGRFLRVNQRLGDMLGYDPDELLTLDACSLQHPDDARACREAMQRLFDGEVESLAQELRLLRRDGQALWVRCTASVARDVAGRPHHLIGIIEDISARRRAEQDLAAARERELQIGARLQQSLLVGAPPPDRGGLQISCHSQASQGIDGDFVEVIRLGPDCVDIITADVMGKGLAAALIGAGTKLQVSRTIAELVTAQRQAGALPSPAAVVDALHRAMTPTLQSLEAFVTLCYLRIDTAADTLTWVGCGHEETLLLHPDGRSELLANQHPPLGVLDHVAHTQLQRPWRAGAALFQCSDGLSDALATHGGRLGRGRVLDAVSQRLRLHPSAAAALQATRRALMAEVAQWQDDVTMIVARRDPPGPRRDRSEWPPALCALPGVRAFIRDHAAQAGLDECESALLEVAGVEAFTNVVRHARGLLAGAPVELVAQHDARSLGFELVYLAEPFELPEELPDTDFASFPEGGFGLQIMRGATDELRCTHVDGVNTLHLIKRHRPALRAAA